MKTLLLIDLSLLFKVHWHATKDQPLGEAFERTVAQVHRLRAGYELCACCVDTPPYLRREMFQHYKAQRPTTEPQELEQLRRVKERLQTDGVLLWGAKGFEADDVAATATRLAIEAGVSVVLASSDKDWMQLVDDRHDVRVLSTKTGAMFRCADVVAKFGIGPEMMLDWLALVGDASDNVPGIPKVGPKTATDLMRMWGSLDDVLFNADKNTPKLTENLIAHADAARLARRLIALRTDVPIVWEELFQERKPKPIREVQMPGRDEGFEGEESVNDDAAADIISGPPKPVEAPKSNPPPAPKPEPKSEPRAQAPESPRSAPEKQPAPTALAVQPAGDWSLTLEPTNLKQAWWLAEQLCNSRLYSAYGSPEAVYAIIMRGRSLGLDATTALSAFHVIEGKPAMHADLIEALVLRSGKAEYFELVCTTSKIATYATKRVGGRREVQLSFTIEDAFNAQLVEKHVQGIDGYRGISKSGKPSNWDKYRGTMLRHRAKTQLARAVYADIVLGLYTPEELGDSDYIDTTGEAA